MTLLSSYLRELMLALALFAVCARTSSSSLLFEWPALNFTFETPAAAEAYQQNRLFEHVLLAGVKVSSNGHVYVSTPRWKEGVPATLSRLVARASPSDPYQLVSLTGQQPSAAPGPLYRDVLLAPFPSWTANQLPMTSAAAAAVATITLHSVLGFEIDLKRNHLWVLDQGKVAGQAAQPSSIQLIIFDLNLDYGSVFGTGTTTNSTAPLRVFTFAPEVASLSHSFLNDIALDVSSQVAYISDSGLPLDSSGSTAVQAGLIVYDFASNTARRLLDSAPCSQDDPAVYVHINGEAVLPAQRMVTGADGIALSADAQTLFWCALTSRSLYRISTSLLRNPLNNDTALRSQVATVSADKGSASDGLAIGNNGKLYMTMLEAGGISSCTVDPTSTADCATVDLLVSDNTTMVWPDTLSFDHRGNLLFVSNYLHHFVAGTMNFSVPNFRIWSITVDADSAQVAPPHHHKKSAMKLFVPVFIAFVLLFVLVGVVAYAFRRRAGRAQSAVQSGSLQHTSSTGTGGVGFSRAAFSRDIPVYSPLGHGTGYHSGAHAPQPSADRDGDGDGYDVMDSDAAEPYRALPAEASRRYSD